MGYGSGLQQIYLGEYTVYQRGNLYCFIKGQIASVNLSLADSFSMGGQYLFCPAALEPEAVLDAFVQNGIAYLKCWNTRLLFLWVSNPETHFSHWKIHKLEANAGRQSLAFDSYRLRVERWSQISVQDEVFHFLFPASPGYSFSSPDICLAGNTSELCLDTMGEKCGTFSGRLLVLETENNRVMEKLNAGIYFSRILQEETWKARQCGFVSKAYNPVLYPQGALSIDFLLTPQSLYHSDKTRFHLPDNVYDTNFSTNTGKTISVKAGADAALVFQQHPILIYENQQKQTKARTRLYLGIQGEFQIVGADTKLLCGMIGTETVSFNDPGKIQFQSSMPAVYPYEDAALGTTSWLGSTGGGAYYCQPQRTVLYATLSKQEFRYLDVPMSNFQQEIPPIPMLPFRGLVVGETNDFLTLEEGLYQKRKTVLTESRSNRSLFLGEATTAVTPQGIMVEVAADASYHWIGLANLEDAAVDSGNVPDMRFTQVDSTLKQKFQQKELLYVIDTPEEFEKGKPSEGFQFSIEGVGFSLLPKDWRTQEESPTMVIIQYSATKSMEETLSDNATLQRVLANAYDEDNEVKDEYRDFVEVVQDSEFQGILALNVYVSLEEMPEEVRFLMNGINQELFFAPYLIIRTGGVACDEQKQAVLKRSMISGLVDYAVEEKLVYQNVPPDYDYLTTSIRIQIQDNHLISFRSSSELLLNRLFEAKAVAVENGAGNCLVLQGCMVGKDDSRTYQYHLAQSVLYELSGSAIANICIQKVDLLVGQQGSGCFSLAGVLTCHELEGADLFGYGGSEEQDGLLFSQLNLNMERETSAAPAQYFMDYDLLSLDRAASVLREKSFPKRFAVHLDEILVERAGESPEQKGYTSINAPIKQAVPQEKYQGFLWSISLGSLGKLSGTEGITLQLITAFWADAEGGTSYYVGCRIPALLSATQLKLQGIFNMGFQSVSLERSGDDYLFKLHNFHVELLGASFPQDKNDVYVFSDGEHVGWYGAYQEDEK
jgi:hypothetical protein